MFNKRLFKITIIILSFGFLTTVVNANNSWHGYHWARQANPFTLKLGDNVSSLWDSYLQTTANDWSLSSVLNTVVVAGNTNAKTCKATNGRVEVCSSRYGNNGWLGVAQVWVSGLHITKSIVKVNDTYFNTPTYNTPAWRNLVMCQEVGHALGLDHQDEIFNNPNLGTCMDYTSNPSTNQHPNEHDFDELLAIYAHLDSTNTISTSSTGSRGKGEENSKPDEAGDEPDLDDPTKWGKAIKKDSKGKNSVHIRDLGKDEKVFTFVIWVE